MILITGGDGFIGKELLDILKTKKIILLLKKKNKKINLKKYHIVIGNLMREKTLRKLKKKKIHTVIHLASNVDTSLKNHDINTIGTKNLIECLNLKKIKKFIYASSIATMDNLCKKKFSYKSYSTENDITLEPNHIYGQKKLETECYLKKKFNKSNIKLVILRISAVFGKNTIKKGLFSVFKINVKKNNFFSKIKFPGKISLIYVKDLAKIIYLLTNKKKIKKITTIICSTHTRTFYELLDTFKIKYKNKSKYILENKFYFLIIEIFLKKIFFFKKIIPHFIFNKLWQLNLLISNDYNFKSLYTNKFLKNKYTSFENWVLN
ncbi:SDR family oxidoreductase [Candidatus Fonsibacter ubiquis]|uniref:SDR family oxidoreductase n=1 Tax=Candidatus Fonsibacter ubiquis TaxID=1925548 RepID=UPI000C076D5D|nr:SDR family oxidoreductase [Candidatus Fonsibacter ubiquis]